MDGISSRKLTWGICIVGIAIAIISFFFLPEIIPVHFAGNGAADDFGNKMEIFLMPILLLTVTILSGIKSVKYVLMHSKTWLTVGQYNLMIDCVLGIILIALYFVIKWAVKNGIKEAYSAITGKKTDEDVRNEKELKELGFGQKINKSFQEMFYEEKSTCNYVSYGINNVDFGVRKKRKIVRNS